MHPHWLKLVRAVGSLTILGLLAGLFVLAQVPPTYTVPGSTSFSPPELAQHEMFHATDETKKRIDKVMADIAKRIGKSLLLSATISIKNVLVQMTRQFGENMIEVMQTGQVGQERRFDTTTMAYFKDQMLEQTAGEILTQLSALGPWRDYIDICDPSVDLKYDIMKSLQWEKQGQLGIDQIKRNKPKCQWSKVMDNWEGFVEDMKTKFTEPQLATFVTIETFSGSFSPKGSALGNYLLVSDAADQEQAKKIAAAEEQRKEGQGIQEKMNPTKTALLAPVGSTRYVNQAAIQKALDEGESEVDLAGKVAESIPESVGMALLSSFVSQKFLNFVSDYIGGKIFPAKNQTTKPGEKLEDTKTVVRQATASLTRINFNIAEREIDLLAEFVNCPAGISRNINNCVMDRKFAEAVNGAGKGKLVTVEDAIDLGLLSADKMFIGPNDDRNKADTCYEQGYCYSNLVKMRKARIIPIGWELAAQQVNGDAPTLGQIIAGYDVCPENQPADYCTKNDCRFCHLVDKNWVLKYAKTKCEAVANGPLLSAEGGSDRMTYCADTTSCIREDANGKCLNYGYCAAEKNTWKFAGTACPAQFDSCTTVTRADGKEFQYLLNTVDRAACSADAAGCKWYSLWQTDDQNGLTTWSESYPTGYPFARGDARIYLTNKIDAQECPPGAEGCTKLVRTSNDYRTNLVPNGSFSSYEGSTIDGWDYATVDTNGFNGSAAVVFPNSNLYGMAAPVMIAPQSFPRYFVFSAQVKDAAAAVDLLPHTSIGNVYSVYDQGIAVPSSPDADILKNSIIAYDTTDSIATGVKADAWTRIYKVVLVMPGTKYLWMSFTNAAGVSIDDAMIAELREPNAIPAFTDYAAVTAAATYMQKAPDYDYCYDTKSTNAADAWYTPNTVDDIKITNDKPACSEFAQLCAANEVGCSSLQSQTSNVFMSAVYSRADLCPSECAGYQTYSQSPTFLASSQFPLYFIPTTGQQCNAAQVGCEEFTNLDSLQQGGEGLEYYSKIRQCIKPDPAQCGSFYTWIGSDDAGFQLQGYQLKVDAATGEPAVTDSVADGGCNSSTYNPQSTDPVVQSCRQYYNEKGEISYHYQELTISCSDDCHPLRRTLPYNDPLDCTSRGGEWRGDGQCIFNAIPSESRVCSAANAGCMQYKGNTAGTVKTLLEDSFEVSSLPIFTDTTYPQACTGIRLGTGTYNATTGLCHYTSSFFNIDTSYSPASLCTQYYHGVYHVDAKTCWSSSTGGWTGASLNSASMVAGGHSLLVGAGQTIRSTLVDVLAKGQSGTMGFWAKTNASGQATLHVTFLSPTGSAVTTVDHTIYSGNPATFQYYTTDVVTAGSDVVSQVEINADNQVYFDTISFKTLSDTKYLIINSWKTPASCDQVTDTKEPLAQAQLGCDSFVDQNDQVKYLKSVRNTCRQEAVGCEAVIDTKNSNTPFVSKIGKTRVVDVCGTLDAADNITACLVKLKAALPGVAAPTACSGNNSDECTFDYYKEAYCTKLDPVNNSFDTITKQCTSTKTDIEVPADNLLYLVLNKKFACRADEEACTMIGMPNLDANFKVTAGTAGTAKNKSWDQKLVKLDPDTLNQYLCGAEDQRCEEYTTEAGQKIYFKNPGKRVCEWRKMKTANNNQIKYDWFVVGSDEFCRPENVPGWTHTRDYYGDATPMLVHANDPDYKNTVTGADGWVGMCQTKFNSCTAFVDPREVSGGSAVGRAYYYLQDKNLETCSAVSQEEGCLLFSDTSVTDAFGRVVNTYSSSATYAQSKASGKPAAPQESANADAETVANLVVAAAVANQGFISSTYGCENYTVLDKVINQCILPDIDNVAVNNPTIDELTNLVNAQMTCVLNAGLVSFSNDKSNEKVQNDLVCTLAHHNIVFNDSNTVLKVAKDRECAQWYDCKAGSTTFDAAKNKQVFTCQKLGLCDSFDANAEDKACTNFVDLSEANDSQLLTQNTKLTAETYRNRDLTWNSLDYTGYAVANQYPLQFLDAMNTAVATDANKNPAPVIKLTHLYQPVGGDLKCGLGHNGTCGEGDICVSVDWCAEGLTYNAEPADNFDNSPAPACRAYPESDTPFPSTVASLGAAFANANTCTTANPDDCGCFYTTVQYGGSQLTKYFPKKVVPEPGYCQDNADVSCACDTVDAGYYFQPIKSGSSVPSGFQTAFINTSTMCSSAACSAKKLDDDPINNDAAIDANNEPGTCLKQSKKKRTEFRGWEGYCLEQDKSLVKDGNTNLHPCLTWYPLEQMAGLQSVYNNFKEAGFDVAGWKYEAGGPYYCTDAGRWEYRTAYPVNLHYGIDCQGTNGGGVFWEQGSGLAIKSSLIDDPIFSKYFRAGVIDAFPKGVYNGNEYYLFIEPSLDDTPIETIDSLIAKNNTIRVDSLDGLTLDDFFQKSSTSDKYLFSGCNLRTTIEETNKLGRKLPSEVCGQGYTAKNLFAAKRRQISCIGCNEEDDFSFFFECVPTNGPGWYNAQDDPKGVLLVKSSLPGTKEVFVYSEEERLNCTNFYGVSNSEDLTNKAHTQRLYSGRFGTGLNTSDLCPALKDEVLAARQKRDTEAIDACVHGNACPATVPSNVFAGYTAYATCLEENQYNKTTCAGDKKYTPSSTPAPAAEEKCFQCLAAKADILQLSKYNAKLNMYSRMIDRNNYCAPFGALGLLKTLGHNPENIIGLFVDGYGLNMDPSNNTCPGGTDPTNSLEYIGGQLCFKDQDQVQQLFAATYGQGQINYAKVNPNQNDSYGYTAEISDKSKNDVNHPPIIAAPIDTGNVRADGSSIITAAINKFAIKTQTGMVTNGDVYGTGELSVNLMFYGWAHDDQMPIRRVLIDWGNGSPAIPEPGYFKNHKPVCLGSFDGIGMCRHNSDNKYLSGYGCITNEDCGSGNTCVGTDDLGSIPSSRFGDTANACTTDMFSYWGAYSCPKDAATTWTSCDQAAPGEMCWDKVKKACRFIPKVQIMDNWDWCSAPGGITSTQGNAGILFTLNGIDPQILTCSNATSGTHVYSCDSQDPSIAVCNNTISNIPCYDVSTGRCTFTTAQGDVCPGLNVDTFTPIAGHPDWVSGGAYDRDANSYIAGECLQESLEIPFAGSIYVKP